jgi:hypothetical protein
MVPAMDDAYRVTSGLYRLMPPRKRARSDLATALDAVGASGSVGDALDAASGTAPDPAEADGVFWSDPPEARQWLRRLGRALVRANWLLIATVVGSAAAVAGAVIGYLTLVKPG